MISINRTLIALAILCSSCATEPGETTGIGAAAGGVLGAGLGAIVGSQTGNAGGGLAIGAVTGAAAGAAIGNSLQARDEDLKTRDQMMTRQEAKLKSQKAEIAELKSSFNDSDGNNPRGRYQWPKGGAAANSQNSKSRANLASDFTGSNNSRGGQDINRKISRPATNVEVRQLERSGLQERELISPVRDRDSITGGDDESNSQTSAAAIKPSETAETNETERPSSIFYPTNSRPLNAPIADKSSTERDAPIRRSEKSSASSIKGASESTKLAFDSNAKVVPREPQRSSLIVAKGASVGKITSNSSRKIDTDSTSDTASEKIAAEKPATEVMTAKQILPDSTRAVKSKSASTAEVVADGILAPQSDPEADKVAALNLGSTSTVSADCQQAESEMNKATQAAEAPDKLFHYRRALRLCPTNPAYHAKLGDLYLSLKRGTDSEYEYREALKLNPNYGPALEKLRAVKE